MTAGRMPLTADQVADLDDGMAIAVIWSGGNGPHRYRVARDRHGRIWARTETDPPWYGDTGGRSLERFVGQERHHTRVWLAEGHPL